MPSRRVGSELCLLLGLALPIQGDYSPAVEVHQPPHRYLLGALVFHLVRAHAAEQLDLFLADVADHPRGSLPCG